MISLISPVMLWRIWVFRKIHEQGRIPPGDEGGG